MPNRPDLMGLPAEMRNIIYRYALVSPERVLLDLSLHHGAEGQQPGLLRVCRQLRAEATGIYYAENTFKLEIPDLKGSLAEPILGMVAKHTGPRMNVALSFCGQFCWDNLLEWLKASHAARTGDHKICKAMVSSTHNIVMYAFRIVAIMENDAWDRVETVLENLRISSRGAELAWIKCRAEIEVRIQKRLDMAFENAAPGVVGN